MRAELKHRRELFKGELRSTERFAIYGLGAFVSYFIFSGSGLIPGVVSLLCAAGVALYTAYRAIPRRQFASPHYRLLWSSVKDRLKRFDTALKAVHAAWDEELPVLRERVQLTADSVYDALCRADIMQVELHKSEGHMSLSDTSPFRPSVASQDKKVQELYQLADRNVAEYRQRLNAVTAGIQRCEAQTTVFITTLDSLRVRLLGYKLMGKSPELEHQHFLETIGEAKSQLDAVDKALEEISFDRLVAQMELEGQMPEETVVHERTVAENVAMASPAQAPPPLPGDAKIEEPEA